MLNNKRPKKERCGTPLIIFWKELKDEFIFLESKNLIFFYSRWKYLILLFVFRLNIFTGKVSNLVLPLKTEGVWGVESYPTSEIPNKYIYDTFSMIYLSTFLLLFFHFLALQRS